MRDARLETFVDELGITRTRWSAPESADDEPVEVRREVKGQPTPPIQPDGRWDGRVRVTRDRAEATNDHAALASWMSRTKVV